MDSLAQKISLPKAGYTVWVLMIVFACLLPFAYISTLAIPLPFFFSGLLLLGFWKYYRRLWVILTPILFLLVIAFFRSDFVALLLSGLSIPKAFAASTQVFLTPQLIFLTLGATLLAVDHLEDARAKQVMTVVKYALLGFGILLAIEALSMGQFQHYWRTQLWGHTKPYMVIVRLSNSTTAMLLFFWPLTYYLNHFNRRALIFVLAAIIIGLSLIDGTNIQYMGLIASSLVFMAAKYWPESLNKKGFGLERALSLGAVITTLGFPFLILALKSRPGWNHLVTSLPESWGERLKIWSFAVDRCLEKPWFGWGYEGSRLFEPMIPVHPHNMALQAWLELGIFGLILLSAFWGLLFLQFKPLPRPVVDEIQDLHSVRPQADIYPYLVATASLYFMINTLSFGLWRSWIYCLGAIAAMLCILVYKAVRHDIKQSADGQIPHLN